MLPSPLKISHQGLLPFVFLGELPLSPKLVLRDCFCHSPTLLLREPYPSKLPLRDCFPHLLFPSLLLGESLPFPCSSEMVPFTPGVCSHSPQGLPFHPQNCPSRIAPLAAPLCCFSRKCSLILKAVPQVWPLIIFRDYSLMDHPLLPLRDYPLIPKTVPQGLTLSSSRAAPFVP